MNLLVDLGHSRLKWALDDGRWQVESVALQAGATAAAVAKWRLLAPQRVLLAASPGHPLRDQLGEQIHAQLGSVAESPVSPLQLGTLRNGYRAPENLGIDRFLAMLAVHERGLAPCVVADCGTALTLDALAADGRHLGGAIVPGRALLRESLAAHAPVLDQLPAGEATALATSTADALASGAAYALAGAVSRFRQRNAAQLGAGAGLVLTGGDGSWLAALLEEAGTVFPHAVLHGLAIWARLVPHRR